MFAGVGKDAFVDGLKKAPVPFGDAEDAPKTGALGTALLNGFAETAGAPNGAGLGVDVMNGLGFAEGAGKVVVVEVGDGNGFANGLLPFDRVLVPKAGAG